MVELIFAFFLVAHRGASADAPENTLPAFELAWKQGADAIEGDFQLTKDGHIVCIHDSDTKKVAGKTLQIAQSTLAELKTLDVGSWKHRKFENTRIPTLAEVLATVPVGKKIFIEIKTGPEMVAPLQKALARCQLKPEQIVVISFDASFVTAWKKREPDCRTMLIISHNRRRWGLSPSGDRTLALLKETGADGLSSNTHRAVNRKFVKRLREAGYEHHVWTVNDSKTARRFLAYGTRSITTDRPGALRKELMQR
ncbi:glycerophosphodiester phosphodiesterase [Roseibacillus persicicus]|uniref:glycerophosphodiester phosphodiesterase n=1 Tax=Roseibacillus persicicus TaxID=454148 RepID=UPI00398A9DEB